MLSQDCKHCILVHDRASLVDNNKPVGVAVEADPERCLAVSHVRPQVGETLGGRFARAAGKLSVEIGVQRVDIGAQPLEYLRGRQARNTVPAVDRDPESIGRVAVVAGVLDNRCSVLRQPS